MGLETIGWGFRKTDGVPVGLVGSQWGRPSMGMLQGVEGLFCTVVARLKSCERLQRHYVTRFLQLVICLATALSHKLQGKLHCVTH